MRRLARLVLVAALIAAAAAPAAARKARSPYVQDTLIQDAVEAFRRAHDAPVSAAAMDSYNCTMVALLFDQRVDHFSPRDTRTWKQRYYVCNGFYAARSRQPVFVYLGAEGPLDGPFGSLWSDRAQAEGGLLVYIEHRYYGRSMPFDDASLTNEGLFYLTAEQALADYAAITRAMWQQFQVPRQALTLGYGGSYGGSLAVYARQLHPQVFSAVHASSAVVKMVLPTRAYEAVKADSFTIISASLREAGGERCHQYTKAAFEGLQFLQGSPAGRQQLALAVGMCDASMLSTAADVIALATQSRWVFWDIFKTQFTQVNPTNFLALACAAIPHFPATPLGAVQWLGNVTRSAMNVPCFPTSATIPAISDQSPRPTNPALISYFYQSCRQGFPQYPYFPSCPPGSIYGSYAFRLPVLDRWCRRIYGLQRPLAPPRWLYNPQLYARLGRIIFASSSYDPWRPGSVQSDLGPTVHAVFTPRASHCSELYAAKATTLPQINATQARVKAIVRRWALERDWHGGHH